MNNELIMLLYKLMQELDGYFYTMPILNEQEESLAESVTHAVEILEEVVRG